eukprot:EG_transcript_3199
MRLVDATDYVTPEDARPASQSAGESFADEASGLSQSLQNDRCGEGPGSQMAATPETLSTASSNDDVSSETSSQGPLLSSQAPLLSPTSAPGRPEATDEMTRAEQVMRAKYRFGKTLGMGNFGTVKLAEDRATGVQWAVKVLNKHALKESTKQERVLKEIRILKLFCHPHVIKLQEVVDTPDNIMLVMEYIEWGNLLDYVLEYDPIPEPSVRHLFQQLICGVEHIHYLRVVHRDIKLDNLLVDRDLNLKIADFGLSSAIADGSFLWTSCGTPDYAAPELVSGRLYAGPEVDVWGCGVVLYALLCGRLPFDDENVAKLFQKIQTGSYEPPHRGSPAVTQLVQRMLLVDQLRRITIPEIRETEWFRADLPPYLAVSPEEHHRREDQRKRDQQVVEYITKRFGLSKEIIHRLLSLSTSSDVSSAYQTLVQAKHQRKKAMPLQSSPMIDLLVSRDRLTERQLRDSYNDPSPSTPLWCLFHAHLPVASPSCRPARLPSVASDMPPLALSSPTTTTVPGSLFVDREPARQIPTAVNESWRLGFYSQLDSQTIMQSLYSMLKSENLKWKVVDYYKLHCRELAGTEDILALHLYRIAPGESSFIVDLNLLHPNVLEYMELAHRLYSRMVAVL